MATQTMKFKNTTDKVIILDSIGLDPVKPHGEIDVPLELCAPGRTAAGSRSKSVLECVAPQLKPSDPKDAEIWGAVPTPPTPKSKIVSLARHVPQEAPGVKALRELKAKQEAEAKASVSTPKVTPKATA